MDLTWLQEEKSMIVWKQIWSAISTLCQYPNFLLARVHLLSTHVIKCPSAIQLEPNPTSGQV